MSFILDALKKSESDRQRQSGPALFEVKVAPPRNRLPLWAIAVAVLLAVNLVIVGWLLLRRSAAHAEGSVLAAATAAPLSAPATVTAAPPVSAPSPQPPAPAAAATVSTAAPAPTVSAVPASASGAQATAAAAAVAALRPGRADETPSAEDLAPAAEPAPVPVLGSHVRRGTVDGVPLYQDWAATPGSQVPPLRLDLHVYAPRPEDRFVMINMKKLREGDSLPEGVRVESITPEGAVLSYSGSRFLLPRD
jgi:general secretion pathway protein B